MWRVPPSSQEVTKIPSTVHRVPQHTAGHVNERIRQETEERVARIAVAGREAIDRRLAELDHEWDIERTLEANAATLTAVGAGLALLSDHRFALVPLVVGSFLLQHAVQGWCPPLPVFRRLGVRSQPVIDYERYALKSLRGDFRNLLSSEGDRTNLKIPPDLWQWRFGDSVAKRFIAAFLGGALMMFGARLAQGCTSGHGISGSLQLAVSSWTFVVVFFAMGIATAFLMFGKEGMKHV